MSGGAKHPGGRGSPAKPRYLRHLEPLASGGRARLEAFKLFCTMAACAVALRSREDEYREAVAGWERAELEVLQGAFPLLVAEMEENPHVDLLGPAYEALGSPADRLGRGEFYTPQAVSDLVAELNVEDAGRDWPEERPLSLLEPACGSGGMVLSFVKAMHRRGIPPSRVRVKAWDVSKTACDMAYTNLTLWGVPATVVWGNSLSGEVTRGWRNPLWADPHLGRRSPASGLPRAAPRRDRRREGDDEADEREAS